MEKYLGWQREISFARLVENIKQDNNTFIYDLDILDKHAIIVLLKEVHPEHIFHLAAQSFVSLS